MKTRQVSYFDLFTTGVGYLNRVTEVTMEEGMPFLTVKIAALRGRAGNVKKTYFDAKVSVTPDHEPGPLHRDNSLMSPMWLMTLVSK
ncbi:MAG: DUF3577 domain-containing protein [Gammaproteobacteria bacterium]|nr:DUF3577 domain-containing protein [Gammaproteobacteria bacterium]